ncbi:MAG: DUF481 domain-containing protein [Candidatus Thorarchaeota archaeon]
MCFLFQCSYAGMKNNVEFEASIRDGNTESIQNLFGYSFTLDSDIDVLKIGAEYEYSEKDNIKDQESFSVYEEWERTLIQKIYAMFNSSIKYDQAQEVERCLKLSPGIGVYLFKNDRTKISVDGGVTYFIEKLDNQSLQDGLQVRARQRAEVTIIENIKLVECLEYYPDVDNFNNYEIKGEVGIEAGIYKGFKARILYRDEYQSRPLANVENNDVSVVTGVSYEF